jgi:asparagine synthetase B (glutamine-hydrolysing)
MCSFLITNKSNFNLHQVNKFNKFRGPDATNYININGYTFLHNLLSITGKFTTQPFVEDDIVAIYNGEIYNYNDFGNYSSDGECIVDVYKNYGKLFSQKLDGEFAVGIVDFKNNLIIFSTDIFKTKPLFYSFENGEIGVSTYSDPLKQLGFNDIKKAKPNTIYVIDLNKNIIEETVLHNFDCNQFKLSFDDWNCAFEKSISKRTKNIDKKLFIGLSSGYDSGVICCELLKQNVDFKSFSVWGTENHDIILQRLKINQEHNKPFQVLYKNDNALESAIKYIKTNTEEFKYTICSASSNYNEFDLSLTDDNGAKYFSLICQYAKADDYKVVLSGQGPDEIYSDYGFQGNKIYNHSNFGGLFPKDLSSIFPWNSFFGSSMESYIAKEEYVGGAYGIEVRYPFLDKQVIQEFLWLDSNLKNANYKAPLKQYCDLNNYPYFIGKKGF